MEDRGVASGAGGVEGFRCGPCGSERGTALHRLEDRTIVVCDACGTGTSIPEGDGTRGASQEQYFTEDWIADRRSQRIFFSLQARGRYAYLRRHRPGRKILEIGYGTGEFLGVAQRKGHEVVGVDISSPVAQYVRERFPGVVLRAGYLSESGCAPGEFETVVAFHVVEHVDDLDAFFSQVSDVLAPGGMFFVIVPNIDSSHARIMGERWLGFIPAHVRQFSAEGLRRCFESNGFAVLETVTREPLYSFWAIYPFYFLRQWLRGLRGKRETGAETKPLRKSALRVRVMVASLWYRVVVTPLLWPFIRVLESRGKGDELYVVGRKERCD